MNKINRKEMQDILYDGLRLMHYPVAVKFIFDDHELERFKEKVPEYYTPLKKTTFCQWEIAARMKGQIVLAMPEDLGCTNAMFVFGLKGLDQDEIKSHAKYTRDLAQAERFVKTKSRLPEGKLKAVVVSPLAEAYFPPDTVHIYCDTMQAYHLVNFYMSAMDVHPLTTNLTMNSAACCGNVHSFVENSANLLTACSGSYNAGKTERGEINVIIPGAHLELFIRRMTEHRERYGSYALTRPGDAFPGADICKNCPLIVFKKNKIQRKT
ncbi:MAG: DUF169 domain-containing protein [Desulfovibrionaceae bacterium]|nr:DUF169 domain-containing protein [Desulfovibrionaceae bacterium]